MNFRFGFCDEARVVSVRVNEDNFASTAERKAAMMRMNERKKSEENYMNEGRKTLSRLRGLICM